MPLNFVRLAGLLLAVLSPHQLLDYLFSELDSRRGGWVLTANLDILRRYAKEPEYAKLYSRADIAVADGMPLVWASRLRGTPLPERVAGSSLVTPLFARAEAAQRSVFLLGGDPSASSKVVERLRSEHPSLRIAGQLAPKLSAVPTAAELADVRRVLEETKPDIILSAFGSPKQEHVIAAARDCAPSAWWLGVGASLSFYSGHMRRAPEVLQNLGLEWAYRLAQEPTRLFKRYIVDDVPFAIQLFGTSLAERLLRRNR
jgi:N-acetylglucosaminyldiphosphoundecaprenol N-acetyl-beta-D-mannosaminyltransferase